MSSHNLDQPAWTSQLGGTLPQFAVYSAEEVPTGAAGHIARHDPARTLREVEAKRRIMDEHQRGADDECARCGQGDAPSRGHGGPDGYPCATLRLLALPYADHPDYREAWKP